MDKTNYPLYQHQKEALALSTNQKAFALFMEMGVGKSAIIIHETINLIEKDAIDCVVIIAPNQVHANWESEYIKHMPPNYDKLAIQIWRSKTPLEKKEKETRAILSSGKVLVFLMNIEALSSDGGKNYLKRILLARRKTYMVVDESHKIKTPGAIRTKAIIELGRYTIMRRIATGTEAEEGLEGLWSQFRFLDDSIIGHRSFTSFKHMYCIENQQQLASGQIFRQIVGYKNQEMLAQKIAPYTYQKRKVDCLDLPDKVYVTHEIDLTKEQDHIYNELKEKLLYELKNGELVDATLAISRMMRLQQVLCGHINDMNDHKTVELIPSNRAAFVAELVEDAASKVIVFCRFIKDVELVTSALARSNIGSIGVSSHVEGSHRLLEIDKWRQEKDIKALVMTIATGGTGLTLVEANSVIFYSNNWSGTDRIQAEDRAHRIGQNSKVTYHDIIVPGHVDQRLLTALKEKRNLSSEFRSNIDNVTKFLNGG